MALQRATHMLCLTLTFLSMLSSYLSQTTHFLHPVFTSSPEKEKAGQFPLQPSSPYTADLSSPAESKMSNLPEITQKACGRERIDLPAPPKAMLKPNLPLSPKWTG